MKVRTSLVVLIMVSVVTIGAIIFAPTQYAAGSPLGPYRSPPHGPGFGSTMNGQSPTVSWLSTFRRWDGTWLPSDQMNWITGDWPYRVTDSGHALTVETVEGKFTQGKVTGARYEFPPTGVKEVIDLTVASLVPIYARGQQGLVVPFSTDLTPGVEGTSIVLRDMTGSEVWRTASFLAWDSSDPRRLYNEPITSVDLQTGSLVLVLNARMLAEATYPLYLDPTWTLSTTAGWGSSTFVDAVEDKGDHKIKIGWLADSFSDNTNEQWTIEGGSATFAGGVMQLAASTTVKAGSSWADLKFRSTVRFTSSGVLSMYFRYQDANNHYFLEISEVGDTLALRKRVSGTLSTIASVSEPIVTNVDYVAVVTAAGNSLKIGWQGVTKWSGNDPTPPPSPLAGPIKFATGTGTTANVDEVWVWNTAVGTMTTPVRDAGTSFRPLETKVVGTANDHNQIHLRIRSSSNNNTWGPWTNLKADVAGGVFYKVPDQDRQRYYQLRVILTSGVDYRPELAELTTTEGTPSTTPSANTGFESWYPYVGGLVNPVNGNLWYSVRDISVQGRGFSLAIVRSYNSLWGSEAGPFGNGWTHNYNERLVVNPDLTVTWNDGDGSQHVFTPKPTSTEGYGAPRGVPSRLVKNGDASFTLWHTDGSRGDFTSTGRLSKIVDKNGNNVTLTYDGSGLLSTVADDSGKSLTLTYDASNRVQTVTDPLGRQITYGYTGSELTSVRDALSQYENHTYASGKMSAIIDPVGKRTAFTYDGSSRVTEIWLGRYQSGSVVWQFRQYTIAYTSTTDRTITNAKGFATTLTLNSFGNPTQIVGPSIGQGGFACGDHAGNSTAYTSDGEMNKIADGRGNSWTVDYDHRSKSVSSTDPGGNVSSSAWSEVNRGTQYIVFQTSQTNFRGFITSYKYDARGNLIKTTDAKNQASNLFYDSRGFLNRSQDFRGFNTWYEYNANGYRTKMTNPLNEVTLYGYDAVGRQTTVTSPLGFVSTTTYDPDDRVTMVTDPLSNFTLFEYNARGDRTKMIDPDGHPTTYAVNVTNRRAQVVTDALGNQTTLSYDLRGNLLSVKDANNHVTSYEYDTHDRQTKVTAPMGFATSYRYDAAGNRIGRTDANGASTTYSFDRSNRLTTTRYPGGSTVTFGYDQNSNPASEVGFGYTKTNTYDELDRVTSVTMNYGAFSKTTTYTYDAIGNRLTALDPESGTTSYAYDAANRQWKITDPETRVTTYVYDRDSRVTSTTYANGVVTTNTWNAAGHLMKVETKKSDSTLIERFEYTYDKSGNRLSVKLANASVTSYEYDKLHRLTKMTEPGSVVTTYKYDAVGNLVEEKKGSTTKTYAYDADDRLWDTTVGAAGMRYGYDNNGNRIWAYDKATQVNTSFAYDYENRMTTRGTCTYTYAPNGERMSSACSAPTYYRYDSPGGGALPNVAAEYDSTGTRQSRYTHGPGVDEPVEQLRGGSYYTYQKDGLGSVSRVTDAGQSTVNAYTYSPWGDTSSSGPLANPYRYTGREADAGSSLYHYRARAYDPEARRFVQKDPAGMADGPNLYAYAGDNPVSQVDPSGKGHLACGWWDAWCWAREVYEHLACSVCGLVVGIMIPLVTRGLAVSSCFWMCSPLASPVAYAICTYVCVTLWFVVQWYLSAMISVYSICAKIGICYWYRR